MIRDGQLYYLQSDHLGTSRRVIEPVTNTVRWHWPLINEPFGDHAPNEDPELTGTIFEFNLRFPGQYFDQETGLHYNYFRDYEPGTGRYVQSDPIGLQGGLNTYLYTLANPVKYIDPKGLVCTGVPDYPFGFGFSSCCQGHDNCYAGCAKNRKECDKAFYECMKNKCENLSAQSIGSARRDACRRMAQNYYWGVRAFGWPFYLGRWNTNVDLDGPVPFDIAGPLPFHGP